MVAATDRLSRWLGRAARSLRVQVSVAILVAAGGCAVVAAQLSGAELEGAYRDGGRQQLISTAQAATAGVVDAREPNRVRRRLEALMAVDERLHGAAVRDPRGSVLAFVGTAPGDPTLSRRVTVAGRPAHTASRDGGVDITRVAVPLGDGADGAGTLELSADFAPFAAAVDRRTRHLLLGLGALLLGFTVVTALVLDRGIFAPLYRLRLATRRIAGGRLDTRMGWTRRDELGALAHDFDAMAAQLEEDNRRLEALVLCDPLTGLANHRHFQEELVTQIQRARTDDRPLALAIVDLDHFKSANDARGHPFGDSILALVGAAIRDVVPEAGFAARLGGDEFALLLPDSDGPDAIEVCEAVRNAVRAASPPDFELTCSAGVACLPADAGDAESLALLADGALYWAKGCGRDRTRRYDPEHVVVVTCEQRVEFAGLIEAGSNVSAHFQPIVALADGGVAGYEALARFNARQHLPASWWFEHAHRLGLGPALEATAVAAALAAPDRPPGTFLSLNLSPSAVLTDEVAAALPARLDGLVIEITEQERINEHDALQAALDRLRARGARIAVDDASGGYAGLQWVMRMRADIIKVDRGLIQDIHRDPAKAALVSSLVHFASCTGAEVCAEGIEHLEELRLLKGLGVTYGQGFVLGRPAEWWPEVDLDAAATCRVYDGERLPAIALRG
ncbi:MAG: EAL domain-containing protein [Solirubrobacteraceae bacterium MAG38_C4-C5]|nr:EAL domain-containing protein [Candidatus Siliceabacter maunaloa]